MAILINLSIDATKISKSKMKDGKYVALTISVKDEVNEWGKNVSVFEEQTKEERDAKANRNYIGSGTTVWSDTQNVFVPEKPKKNSEAPKKKDDELPF